MSRGPEIHIEPPQNGASSDRWETFVYSPDMPWGPWYLSGKPKEIFKVGNVRVFECTAKELVQDEQGYVAESTLAYDPCFRHFLVGQTMTGEVIWWHNLIEEYDREKRRFAETSITLTGKLLIVKGYGGGYRDENKGKAVCIDVDTGKQVHLD